MIDVCLLGTGGMLPLPYRAPTSLMVRYNGSHILIDCGEGTQNQIRMQGWSFHPIDVICITHFHADHISGLPGLLLTTGNAERTAPLTIIGPKGLTKVVNSLRIIAPELPFEIQCTEITEANQTFSFDGFRIEAFKVNHNVGVLTELLTQIPFNGRSCLMRLHKRRFSVHTDVHLNGDAIAHLSGPEMVDIADALLDKGDGLDFFLNLFAQAFLKQFLD